MISLLRVMRASIFTGFSLIIMACGSGGDNPPDTTPQPSPTVTPTPTPLPTASRDPEPFVEFANPLYYNGADPWLEYHRGNYYLTTTTWTSQLVMRKSPTIEGFATAKPQYVWSDTEASRAFNFWAFEFHRLDGPNGIRWYLMYTAGIQADLGGQRLHVLESAGDDPTGPYEFKSTLMPNRWNIDGSYLEHEGQLYLLWSEWVGPDQSTWIAEMDNPWTVDESTAAVLIRPELDWEFGAELNGTIGRVTEGPAILKHEGRIFMSYSTNPCHGPNYKLGVIELVGSDPLAPGDWSKHPEPMFVAANGVYGPGHNGFFKSPDGSEDWLVYHGNDLATQGCGDTRAVRVQPISYTEDGFPVFGEPAIPGEPISVPAGETGPIEAQLAGMPYHIVDKTGGRCLQRESDGSLTVAACSTDSDRWVLDSTADNNYRFNHSASGQFLSLAECATDAGTAANTAPWQIPSCQRWQLTRDGDSGWLQLINTEATLPLTLTDCTDTASGLQVGAEATADCSRWRLQPAGEFAITSQQSGRVVQTDQCATSNGTTLVQWQWNGSNCQRWTAEHSGDGYYFLHPVSQASSCMILTGEVANAGADIVQGNCSGDVAQWIFDPLTNGAMRVLSRASGHAVDLDSCQLGNGTNIRQWEWLNNDCQMFTLKTTASDL